MDVNGTPTLAVRVTLEGADTVAAGLSKVASAGDTVEKSTTRLAGAMGPLTRLQADLANRAREVADAAQLVDVQNKAAVISFEKHRDSVAALAARLQQTAVVESELADATQTLIKSQQGAEEYARRLAAAQKEVGDAGGTGALGLGRLRMELGTFAGRATETSPILGRMVGAIASMSLGNPVVIGILAGVAAVGFAYEHFSANAKKAKEEQDKLTDSLQKWYEKLSNGPAGERSKQVEADIKLLAEQQKHLDELNQKLNSPTANRSEGTEAAIIADINKTTKAMADERAYIAAGSKDVTTTLIADFNAQRDAQASALADRLKFNEQDETARQAALKMLKEDQALYAQYLKLPNTPENSALVAEYANQIQTLNSALNPKQETPTIVHGVNQTIEALQKQLGVMQKANEADNNAFADADKQRQLLGLEGEARAQLANQLDAETQRMEARHTLSGTALSDTLARIDAIEKEKSATISQGQTQKDAAAFAKLLGDSMKDVTSIGSASVGVIQQQAEDMAKFRLETDRLSDALGHDLLRSFDQFAEHGAKSFRDLYSEALRLTLSFEKDYAQSIDRQSKIKAEAIKAGDAEAAVAATNEINRLEGLQRITGIANGALVGASAGYNSGNVGIGAISGAAAGSQYGIPGAIIGGLAGVVGGLLGAAEAHRQAAKAVHDAADALNKNFASAQAQVYGGGYKIASDITNAQAIGPALIDQLNNIRKQEGVVAFHLPTSPVNTGNYQSQVDQYTQLSKDAVQKVATDFAKSLNQQLNALNGPAGELVNTLADLDDAYTQNIASIDALRKAGLITADEQQKEAAQAQQIHDQSAAAAQNAFDEQRKQAQEDLAVRLLAATGTTHQVDEMRAEIAARRELAAATADDIDAIKAVQAAEAAQRAADFARANQQAQEDAQVRVLRATGQTDAADALALQLQQQREYNDAVQAGLTDATLAALKLADAAEQAQLAAQQAENALQAMVSGIKQDQSVLGLSNDQTLSAEAAAFGFAGMTIDQIKALYVQHDHALSDAEETLDKHIAQYVQDYNGVHGASSAAAEVHDSGHDATSGVQSDVTQLTEGTGTRMADYLSAINVHTASIDSYFTGNGGSRFTGSVTALQPVGPSSFGGGSSSITVNMYGNVTVENVTDLEAASDAFVKQVERKLGANFTRASVAVSPQRTR